jgi:hypothetical protein
MFKAKVLASEASPPYNTYDSVLEIPGGKNPDQNAWLTLQLRVMLNFVDSKNQLPGLTVNPPAGGWFARDHDGYLFPILDWPVHLISRFQKEYVQRAEKTWNWQFVLITPKTYSELDYTSYEGGGFTVRPNVLCLFRMSVHGPLGGAVDSSPAAGPMASGTPHRTINVVNLAMGTKTVNLAPGITPTAAKPATKTFGQVDGLAFRSNELNYDDSDLFKPAWWQKEHHVLSNTVGHEVGHSLGQCHVMGLKGDPQYAHSGVNSEKPAAYGVGSSDKFDAWNIMGGGDRVYLLNAVSWSERIALHTGTAPADWVVTGNMGTPTRKLPIGLSAVGVAPSEW